VDPYGKNKYETLLQLQELTKAVNARLTWARIFQPYGLGQDSERLIPWAVNRMLAKQEIRLQKPNMSLDWISSRDIANAISWSIKNVTPEVIDIGTAIGTSVHAVLIEVARILGVNPEFIRAIDASESQTPEQSLVVSSESPLFQSGWRPDDSLQSGLSWALGK
jgi:nucleoside-diphosphate-sugar epimerase